MLPFRTVIEVGVNEGQDTPTLLTQENMILYGFEPTYELAMMLTDRFQHDSRVNIIPLAVDLQNRFTTFNIAGWHNWGCSSLHEFADDLKETWSQTNFHYTKRQRVMTIRLDDFCRLYHVDQIDYLWIDAQGSDFDVLKSLGDRIDSVKEGRVEVAYNVNLYKNENSYEVVKRWLEDCGFTITQVALDATPQRAEADLHFCR